MTDLLLTPEEAARRLSLSRSKFYELLNADAITSVHIGRARRVRTADLATYVEGLS